MNRLAGTSLVALAVAALLASLSLVAERQVKALDTMDRLDSLRRDWALEVSEVEELERRIRQLESYGRVVPEAESRLGLHKAVGEEVAYLVEGRPDA